MHNTMRQRAVPRHELEEQSGRIRRTCDQGQLHSPYTQSGDECVRTMKPPYTILNAVNEATKKTPLIS